MILPSIVLPILGSASRIPGRAGAVDSISARLTPAPGAERAVRAPRDPDDAGIPPKKHQQLKAYES
jgi:hypothetical protein